MVKIRMILKSLVMGIEINHHTTENHDGNNRDSNDNDIDDNYNHSSKRRHSYIICRSLPTRLPINKPPMPTN